MRVLVACEESQEVCKAFRALGHEAYSCDIEPCSGGHPEWHLQVDALEMLKMRWDMILAFPPCTYLSNAGAKHLFRGGSSQPGALPKRTRCKRIFFAISERQLSAYLRGKSSVQQNLRNAALQPRSAAVDVWTPCPEENQTVAERVAAIGTY